MAWTKIYEYKDRQHPDRFTGQSLCRDGRPLRHSRSASAEVLEHVFRVDVELLPRHVDCGGLWRFVTRHDALKLHPPAMVLGETTERRADAFRLGSSQ